MSQSPWNVMVEISSVLKDIKKHHPLQYNSALDFKHRIEACAWKVPTVQLLILKNTKMINTEECCNVVYSDILLKIEQLRPVTMLKLMSESWRHDFEINVHDPICCMIYTEQQMQIEAMNTFTDITEIPNYSVKGLPGFKYPTSRMAPLRKLERPVKPRKVSTSGPTSKSLLGGGKLNYNIDGVSKVFGPYNKIGERFTSSPLEPAKSMLCGVSLPGIKLDGGFSACAPQLPDLSLGLSAISIPIPECLSQFLPPMFLPKISKPSLTLGGGQEFGIYANNQLISDNFGIGFDPSSPFVAEVKGSGIETGLESECLGLSLNLDINLDPRKW